MKSGMEWGLLGLILALIGAMVLAQLSSATVSIKTARAQASVAAGQIPEVAVIGGQVSGWALSAMLSILGIGLATALVMFVRAQLRIKQRQAWKSGPNARWQKSSSSGTSQGKSLSTDELMRLMLMREMGMRPHKEEYDEPTFFN